MASSSEPTHGGALKAYQAAVEPTQVWQVPRKHQQFHQNQFQTGFHQNSPQLTGFRTAPKRRHNMFWWIVISVSELNQTIDWNPKPGWCCSKFGIVFNVLLPQQQQKRSVHLFNCAGPKLPIYSRVYCTATTPIGLYQLPGIPNSYSFCCCYCSSQKASHGDISGTKRGIIDPLGSKRPEKSSE